MVLKEYVAALTQPMLGGGPTRYDEVVGPDGLLRPSWKRLAAVASGLGASDLRRIDEQIVRFLADDGVTYSRAGRRPTAWRLDPVPMVVDAASWRELEVGLAQRAELLNAVLVDLYGGRTLLRDGIVPAAAVLAHPGFTRIMAYGSRNDPRPLVTTATDIGRDASGAWRVLGDRTQAPSGLGYALENRKVLSRVLPELYREADLHRMAPYLWAFRSALLQSAHGELPDPRVVVLTPGTHSETAYDQAALATSLGFPLVQGSDLVVRDGWVLLKSLGRLERVDVILRRVDASFCDPLELRGDSQLGVAGLAEAVRRERVRVVNGLGAGVLENPALLAYAPAICEHLLGESLRLPTVATWWCGDPDARAHVLANLESLSVRMVDTVPGAVLDVGPEALARRIEAAPHRFVAQERLPLSQSPTWTEPRRSLLGTGSGRAEPRPVTLRAFTVRYGSSYRTLLGGLGNVMRDGRTVASKDVWVLKAETGEPDQGLAEVMPVTSGRSLPATVPRVLEDMFWVGRYAERAEDLLRLVLAAHVLVEDFRSRPRTSGGLSLSVVTGLITRLAGRVSDDYDEDFRSLLLDQDRAGSVAQSLEAMRDALSGVRDQWSSDVWRIFGVVDRAQATLAGNPDSHQVAESAGRMLTGVLSLAGVTANMIRDPGWHMISVGRYLERSQQVGHLLTAVTERHGLDVDREILASVLAAAESSVTHRRRYRDFVRPAGVLDLLLKDPENPRSLAFSVARASEHLAALPASTGSTRPERLLAALGSQVEETKVAGLVAIGGADRPNLVSFLATTGAELDRLAAAVADLHFATGPAPRSFGSLPELEPVP
ncbi:circularly permuted type 2 ATP-grasp protein [Nocardioides pelophilus]|uniref:circularly permuted type 2 ATP-grasp protein n=1 Tax=Nocardioides pelophilus TaxID=2172019 RepID=UPI0028A870BC|nr:circularly permuted type 2 ATP-grasp protein [Nocardioides pelophilus]